MLNDEERRVASLVVAQYGVDPADVDRVVDLLLHERSRGRSVDLLDRLREADVLSLSQVYDMRLALSKTRVDPNGPLRVDPDLKKLKRIGPYRVLRFLGEGGMGAVFLAFDEEHRRQVALKVLSAEMAKTQANLDRFMREAEIGARLDHPNVVKLLQGGQDGPLHYLVLEYIDGINAQDQLERGGRFSVGDAFRIVLDVARALEHAHALNIIHRDIKPGNILVANSGRSKLSDLGLAKRTDETSHLTQTKQGFGTPYYVPYEQSINAKTADVRSDIFALGATLYHLLTGEVPFPGLTPVEILDKKATGFFVPAGAIVTVLPDEVDRILGKMMARDPADRYQTMSEVIADLERSKLAAATPSFAGRTGGSSDTAPEMPAATGQATLPDLAAKTEFEPHKKRHRHVAASIDDAFPLAWILLIGASILLVILIGVAGWFLVQ
jgi:serine/threonine-protein kinase